MKRCKPRFLGKSPISPPEALDLAAPLGRNHRYRLHLLEDHWVITPASVGMPEPMMLTARRRSSPVGI